MFEETRSLLHDEARDPALDSVRLISLELSADGGSARFAYSVLSEATDERELRRASGEALARATGFLRARLASQLELKRLPKLVFAFVGLQRPDALEKGER